MLHRAWIPTIAALLFATVASAQPDFGGIDVRVNGAPVAVTVQAPIAPSKHKVTVQVAVANQPAPAPAAITQTGCYWPPAVATPAAPAAPDSPAAPWSNSYSTYYNAYYRNYYNYYSTYYNNYYSNYYRNYYSYYNTPAYTYSHASTRCGHGYLWSSCGICRSSYYSYYTPVSTYTTRSSCRHGLTLTSCSICRASYGYSYSTPYYGYAATSSYNCRHGLLFSRCGICSVSVSIGSPTYYTYPYYASGSSYNAGYAGAYGYGSSGYYSPARFPTYYR